MSSLYMYPGDTIILKFVENYGIGTLESVSSTIFNSPFFKWILTISITLSIIYLMFAIISRSVEVKDFLFILCLLLILPYSITYDNTTRKVPLIYGIVTSFTKTMSIQYEKSIIKMLTGKTYDEIKNGSVPTTIPPGKLAEMITLQLNIPMNEDAISEYIQFFSKCHNDDVIAFDLETSNYSILHNYNNSQGLTNTPDELRAANPRPATFLDYFNYSIIGTEVVNDNSLSHKSMGNYSPILTCSKKLNTIRIETEKKFQDHPKYIIDGYIINPTGNDDGITFSEVMKGFLERSDNKLVSILKNSSMALQSQYLKSRILKNHSDSLSLMSLFNISHGTDVTTAEQLKLMGSTTAKIAYAAREVSFGTIIGARWAASASEALDKVKNQLEILPYRIAVTKILLNILLPLAIIMIFFGKTFFIIQWMVSYLILDMFPPLVMTLRGITNSILSAHILDGTHSSVYTGLEKIVHAHAAQLFQSDILPMAFALVEQENLVIASLGSLILISSFGVSLSADRAINRVMHTGTKIASAAAIGSVGGAGGAAAGGAAANAEFKSNLVAREPSKTPQSNNITERKT